MRTAPLRGLEVSRIGLGVTHIHTAGVYGPLVNKELLGRALSGRRDQAVIATEFRLVSHLGRAGMDSSLANVRLAVEGSLRRLRTVQPAA